MTTFETGRKAEQIVADFLVARGCQIIEQNWRTRWCEIDIVACRGQTVYLCEVKYRRHFYQGRGLEYITTQKLQQMRRAARFWLANHPWSGNLELCAIEVSGPQFQITAIARDL